MRKWQERNAELSGMETKSAQPRRDIGGHVAVREHDAFGSSRGSGGVNNRCDIIGANFAGRSVKLLIAMVGSRGGKFGHAHYALVVSVVHAHHFLQTSLPPNGKHSLHQLLCGGKNGARAGVAQNVRGLLFGQGRVNRHRYGAQQQTSKICDGPLRTIFAQNRYPSPTLQSPSHQRSAHSDHMLVQIPRRQRRPLRGSLSHHYARFIAINCGEKDVVKRLRADWWAQILRAHREFVGSKLAKTLSRSSLNRCYMFGVKRCTEQTSAATFVIAS